MTDDFHGLVMFLFLSWVELIIAVPGKNKTDLDTFPKTAAGSFSKCMPLNLFVCSFSENTVRLFPIILHNFTYIFILIFRKEFANF